MLGAYVEGLVRWSGEEHGPEPDGEVCGIEVGAERGSVAHYLYWDVGHGVTDEVADGEVGVEGEVGSDKGEAASDGDFEGSVVGVGDAEVFGHALGLVVGG